MGNPRPGPAGAGPVPLAFVGRTSTSTVQNPVESLSRQIRRAQERLPEGFYIARYYWDVECGGTDLDARSRFDVWQAVRRRRHPPRRRHGRPARRRRIRQPAVLRRHLREHRTVRPRHIRRAETGKRTTRARHGGIRHRRAHRRRRPPRRSTILVRRMKQGVAEYFRLPAQSPDVGRAPASTSSAGGTPARPPTGTRPSAAPTPTPIKATMGATRARLIPDPERGPWVTRIYEWRVLRSCRCLTIARRLDRAGAPSPDGNGWSPARRRPHPEKPQVHRPRGARPDPQHRHRPAQGRTQSPPRAPRLLDLGRRRATGTPNSSTWTCGKGPRRSGPSAATSATPSTRPRPAPAAPCTRCGPASAANQCQRRMHGITRPGRTPGARPYIYYLCPHDPKNPRHAQAHPEHPRTSVNEEIITAALAQFMDDLPARPRPGRHAPSAAPGRRSRASRTTRPAGRTRSARNSPGSRPRKKDS